MAGGRARRGLAYFRRKYDALVTEIGLLEQRLRTTDLQPAQAQQSIDRLREAVSDAHAVGDLGALVRRLDGLTDQVGRRRGVKVQREQHRHEAREVKERIVAEAERIAAEETHWKNGGERLRQLVEEWKGADRIDRPTETVLWKRLSAARNAFTKRRKAASPPSTTSARSPAGTRGAWSPRPRRCPAPPTGATPPPPTAT